MKKVYLSHTGAKEPMLKHKRNLEIAYRDEIEFISHTPGESYSPDKIEIADAVIFYQDGNLRSNIIGKGMYTEIMKSIGKKPCYRLARIGYEIVFSRIIHARLDLINNGESWSDYATVNYDLNTLLSFKATELYPVNYISDKFLKVLNIKTTACKELSDLLIKIL
jgi:hypothetical protein